LFSTARLFIKTGIAFLAAGLALGSHLLFLREVRGVFPNPFFVSAHVHAVGIGFVMFLILGVALWLFPRAPKDDTRYRPGRILLAYWILLLSTTMRFVLEVARAWTDAWPVRILVLVGGLGQVAGLALYFFSMWSRIRPVGSHLRESKGERF
jgi:heme/copper-type cytochrome/quinol oxidase subunit 1